MYKVKNDLVPSYISEIFTRKGTRYNLRNSDFEIPRFNTIRYGKHTLRYQGPYIWSKLENGMRELPSLSIFKTKIRRVDMASLVGDSGNCCEWVSLNQVRTTKFARVGVSSSSSGTCSPWWVKPLACSKESSTKATRRSYRSSGRSSSARCMLEKSITFAPVAWKPKCWRKVCQINSNDVEFFTKVLLEKIGNNLQSDLASARESWLLLSERYVIAIGFESSKWLGSSLFQPLNAICWERGEVAVQW